MIDPMRSNKPKRPLRSNSPFSDKITSGGPTTSTGSRFTNNTYHMYTYVYIYIYEYTYIYIYIYIYINKARLRPPRRRWARALLTILIIFIIMIIAP